MNYSRRCFDYYFDKVKDKQCSYGEVKSHYIISTVKDFLENDGVELNEDRLRELCYKMYEEIPFAKIIDDAIQEIYDKEVLIL